MNKAISKNKSPISNLSNIISKFLEKRILSSKSSKNNLYVRFGEIPIDEVSLIHNNQNNIIGKEKGVSVYEAAITVKGRIVPALPPHPTEDATTTFTSMNFKGYRSSKITKVLLVSGDEVGKGSDGEPLIKNIHIIADITNQF